jgi:hypothetical protein
VEFFPPCDLKRSFFFIGALLSISLARWSATSS